MTIHTMCTNTKNARTLPVPMCVHCGFAPWYTRQSRWITALPGQRYVWVCKALNACNKRRGQRRGTWVMVPA